MEKNLELALLQSIKKSESDSIFIDPVCSFFGIQTRNQLDRIKKDPICQSDMQKISCQPVFGDNNMRYCLGKRGFIRWIQIINAAIVRNELRELFIKYQVAVFDYLYNGTEARKLQLEDLRKYDMQINRALNISTQLRDFVSEQNKFKKLCLNIEPEEWIKIRDTLNETKLYPIAETENFLALKATESLSIEDLNLQRTRLKDNIRKNVNTLTYQSRNVQQNENPMPPGYRREALKIKINEMQKALLDIENRIEEKTKLMLT